MTGDDMARTCGTTYITTRDGVVLKQVDSNTLIEAVLSYASLADAYLPGTDLTRANLTGAYLLGADLTRADLTRAVLCYANLTDACLSGTGLARANLCYADLSVADLSGTNLAGANLSYANLTDAYMVRANLSGTDLTGANLSGADLTGAICIPHLPQFDIIPDGDVTGYKKLRDGIICELLIPAAAKRSCATTRKCRAEYAVVVKGCGRSIHNEKFVYREGETVYPDTFDEDRWNECSNGIHFFLTKEEAGLY